MKIKKAASKTLFGCVKKLKRSQIVDTLSKLWFMRVIILDLWTVCVREAASGGGGGGGGGGEGESCYVSVRQWSSSFLMHQSNALSTAVKEIARGKSLWTD